jgi:hypothetical protein
MCPALLWSGWNPTDGPGSLYEYAVFQNAWAGRPPFGPMSPNRRTTGRYQIVIGPGTTARDSTTRSCSIGSTPGSRARTPAWPTPARRYVNLIATLNDVAPDGQVTQLVTGSIVGSLRAIEKQTSWLDKNGLMVRPDHPYKEDHYAKPGSLQRYEIALTPTVSSVAVTTFRSS